MLSRNLRVFWLWNNSSFITLLFEVNTASHERHRRVTLHALILLINSYHKQKNSVGLSLT